MLPQVLEGNLQLQPGRDLHSQSSEQHGRRTRHRPTEPTNNLLQRLHLRGGPPPPQAAPGGPREPPPPTPGAAAPQPPPHTPPLTGHPEAPAAGAYSARISRPITNRQAASPRPLGRRDTLPLGPATGKTRPPQVALLSRHQQPGTHLTLSRQTYWLAHRTQAPHKRAGRVGLAGLTARQGAPGNSAGRPNPTSALADH